MAVQLSVAVRNARLDSLEAAVGAAPLLRLRTGAAPSTTAGADTGTVLATLTLPADFMATASGGTKAKQGTWSDTAAATGTAGHWRMYAADGTTCHLQGTVSGLGAGGDITLNSTSLTAGQAVTITGFSLTDGNA